MFHFDVCSESLLAEINASSRDIFTPSCQKLIVEATAKIKAAQSKPTKGKSEVCAEDKLQARKSTTPRQSNTLLQVDSLVQKTEPVMPPLKHSPSETARNKASIARTIAKKNPLVKRSDTLTARPRAKSRAAPMGPPR